MRTQFEIKNEIDVAEYQVQRLLAESKDKLADAQNLNEQISKLNAELAEAQRIEAKEKADLNAFYASQGMSYLVKP